MHARTPNAGPLRSLSGSLGAKRKEPEAVQVPEPSSKRPRVAAGRYAAVAGHQEVHSTGRAASPAPSQGGSYGGGEFLDKCSDILAHVLRVLGPSAHIFDRPVDGRLVPDYYGIIKNPMDLGTIKSRIENGDYASPLEFYEDMHQVWANCLLYNGKITDIGKLGSRAEAEFEQQWAGSGLAHNTRSRRANAGVAAHKYEPTALPPDKKAKVGNGVPYRNGTTKKGASQAGALQRQRSRPSRPPPVMPREQMMELATQLSELEGPKLTGAIQIINSADNAVRGDANDEIELDFEQLDHVTLWKLHNYLNGTQQEDGYDLMDYHASDSDSESDDDDDVSS
ncbi:hypothetical protein WJX72_000599 [[Myrmecia] bisecta]|uniref:Uncharacterized protein n=1 Tax=[Myrmecia] bisecta TaxID=41462 RepID=A0AAW1Q801_9CHLO